MAVSDDEHAAPGRTVGRLYGGLFLAAYALLLVDLLVGDGVAAWPTLLLGTAYVLVGTLGFRAVTRAARPGLTYAYFALMLPLGAAVFAGSVTGGTFLLLVVAAQSMRVLPLLGTLLIGLPLPLLHAGMAWPHSLREGATFLVALVFLFVLNRAIVAAEQAQAALTAANQQLRDFAAQREALAAAHERNRIAREIHDGLGHYLTTIHMQIQAALAVLDRDRPRAEQTLAKAQGLAHEALGDVRRSVAALRLDPAEPRPLPELLEALVETARATGLPATLAVLGNPRPLGPQAEQALYRAAQEGLTNVRKHARATHATLTLDYRGPAAIRLVVQDDGCGAAETTGGFGLLGLRERVQLLGGQLQVETAPDAGLILSVEVPV
jgi:signal transduction histidine kinase